jgi:hypothetical protein
MYGLEGREKKFGSLLKKTKNCSDNGYKAHKVM